MTDFLTADQVAKELCITTNAVARLCRDKKLGASHPGRKWLIPRESLDEYLQIRR